MSIFRYYITDLFEGKVIGTNDTEEAEDFALCEDYFVVDTETNSWIDSELVRNTIKEATP